MKNIQHVHGHSWHLTKIVVVSVVAIGTIISGWFLLTRGHDAPKIGLAAPIAPYSAIEANERGIPAINIVAGFGIEPISTASIAIQKIIIPFFDSTDTQVAIPYYCFG